MDSGGYKNTPGSTHSPMSDSEELPPWRTMPKKLSTTTSPPWSNQQVDNKSVSGTPLNKSICIDLCWDEEEARSVKKRKRPTDKSEETSDVQKEAKHKQLKRVKELIKGIEELTRELAKHVANNINTKKEIKEAVSTLRARSSQLNTADMWRLINSLTFNQGQTEEIPTRMTATAETSTQTENETRTPTAQTDNGSIPNNGLAQLYQADNMASILKAMSYKWNHQGYPKTRPGIGNPHSTKNNTTIIIDPTDETKSKAKKTVIELYPHTDTLINAGMPKNGKFIQINTVISSEEPNDAEHGKTVYLLGGSSTTDEQKPENTEKWTNIYEGLKKIMEKEAEKGTKLMTLLNTTDTDIVKIRRLTEKIVQHLDMTVIIYSSDIRRPKPEAPRQTAAESGTTTANTETDEPPIWTKVQRKNRSETITIKGVATQKYSEVLGNLKKNININDMNIKVKTIIHDNKNEIKIKFSGDTQEENKFLAAIKAHAEPNMEVLLDKHLKTVFIKDINSMTQKDEVAEALTTALKISETEVEIRMAEKPNNNNLLYAFAKLTTDQANTLIELKKVRIGWNLCRVEEVNNPMICYNCYKYGHLTKNCTNERRERACLNCTSKEHVAKDCKERPKCLNCKDSYHKTYSFSCPQYKEALLTQRQKRTMI